MALLDGLNERQLEAVTAGDGPLLVLAGPGSGKTRVLTRRIAYLIRERGAYPGSVMAVTFTNKAAREMRGRVERLLTTELRGLQVGTFHAICSRLLRREAEQTPYRTDYVIYDRDDQVSAVRQVMGELNIDLKKNNPNRILYRISAAKNELIPPSRFVSNDYFSELVARIYPLYQDLLVSNNAMDFDDLLMNMVNLLRENEMVRERYQRFIEYLLVDEFQDTNVAQYQLVKLLGAPQNNIFVVGDEDQGIYAFRGADYRNVLYFRKDYPNAQVVLLEQNYRSTQTVLDVARAVIDKNPHRTPKKLFTEERKGGPLVYIKEAYDEHAEGDFITETIDELCRKNRYNYNHFAVMYRTNAQSRVLETAFRRASTPYKLVGGVGFFQRREVKDLISYLRVVNNPDDSVALLRVINTPSRGIGKKSIANFTAWVATQGITVNEALERLRNGADAPVGGRAGSSLKAFAEMVGLWQGLLEKGDLVALFDDVLSRTGYTLYITEQAKTDQEVIDRGDNIRELRRYVSENQMETLADFLTDVSLVADVDTLDEDTEAVTMLTLHAAKGLEFPVVFMAGMEDGLLPHMRSLDDPDGLAEERRLAYVGVTRAMDRLYLSYAFRRGGPYGGGPNGPSRFLRDIPMNLTEGSHAPYTTNIRETDSYQYETTWDWSGGGSSGRRSNGGTSRSISPTPKTQYKSGMRVHHVKYGEGMVIESKIASGDEEVTIAFEKVGVKILLTSFGGITPLD